MQASLWVGLSVFVQRGGCVDGEKVDEYLALMEKSFEEADRFMLRVQGRFLRQLCRNSEVFLEKVTAFIDRIKENECCAWLVEDVQTEIAFIRG